MSWTRRRSLTAFVVAACAIPCAAALAGKAAPVLSLAGSPPVLAGTQGAGAAVPLRFHVDARGACPVEVQWGIDRNGDGTIADDEFRPATQALRDTRNTGRAPKRGPVVFRPAAQAGSPHVFVWDSLADAGEVRIVRQAAVRTPQGRVIEDPSSPGDALTETVSPGVQLRARVLRGRTTGAWATTPAFELDNALRPAASLAGLMDDGAAIRIDWRPIHPASEDEIVANGTLDPGEDRDGDHVLRLPRIGIVFEFVELDPGATPGSIERADGSFAWRPCTRVEAGSDPDSGVATYPPTNEIDRPADSRWTWDVTADGVASGDRYLLRWRSWDAASRVLSPWALAGPITR